MPTTGAITPSDLARSQHHPHSHPNPDLNPNTNPDLHPHRHHCSDPVSTHLQPAPHPWQSPNPNPNPNASPAPRPWQPHPNSNLNPNAAPQPWPLPPGWTRLVSPQGREYFQDENTQTTQWHPPPPMPLAPWQQERPHGLQVVEANEVAQTADPRAQREQYHALARASHSFREQSATDVRPGFGVAQPAFAAPVDDALDTLVSMGFGRANGRDALQRTHGDLRMAIELLSARNVASSEYGV
eukprot:TRINITY_DN49551_c0_g1_i1.p1 TRINITY_DN49551_c0_g1~~TRINITY_DN49551_c0_g1_i1.p1  ORF type:complete len:241 (+),score=24.84 TRINITY_DN49551_c0_g1_i1:299-1021(+)